MYTRPSGRCCGFVYCVFCCGALRTLRFCALSIISGSHGLRSSLVYVGRPSSDSCCVGGDNEPERLDHPAASGGGGGGGGELLLLGSAFSGLSTQTPSASYDSGRTHLLGEGPLRRL